MQTNIFAYLFYDAIFNMQNSNKIVEDALFLDALLELIKKRGNHPFTDHLNIYKEAMNSMYISGYIDILRDDNEGIVGYTITDEGARFLRKGGYWKKLKRKTRWKYQRKKIIARFFKLKQAISCKSIIDLILFLSAIATIFSFLLSI